MTKAHDERSGAREYRDIHAVGDLLRAAESGGAVVLLKGLSSQQMARETPALRAALNRHEMPLFVLDPMGASAETTSFLDMLASYMRLAELRGTLTEPTRELFAFIMSADDQTASGFFPAIGGRLYSDTLCRLWTSLSRDMPATLLVLNAASLAAGEAQVVAHLIEYFFADPVEQLMPEVQAQPRGAGRLLLLDEPSALSDCLADIRSISVDLSGSAESSVREFLSDPGVIQRFVESTGGDPKRLGELVESLPTDIHNFWAYRYERLPALERQLVSILAVAAQPLAVDLLHTAAELMQASEYFARSLRELTDLGFLTRSMGSGAVKMQLADPALADSVCRMLQDDDRRARHRALAQAAAHRADTEDHDIFLATHFLAAGEGALGLKYGRNAAKKLMSRRNFEQAQRLLTALLEHALNDDERRELHTYLVEAYIGLGEARRALSHLEKLRALTQAADVSMRLRCQAGRLLSEVGDYEKALEFFDRVTGDGRLEGQDEPGAYDALWLEAELGRADALFFLGRHDQAEESIGLVLAEVAQADQEPGGLHVDQAALDRARLRARNLRGKLAILRAEYGAAREFFEDNRALSLQWGWDDDAARAEGNLGLVALQSGDFSRAITHLEQAQQMARSPAALRRAYIFINLGIVHQRQGQFERALDDYQRCMRIARQEADEAGYALAVYNLVTLYQDLGAFERAQSLLEHLQTLKTQHLAAHFVGDLPRVAQASLLLDRQDYQGALSGIGALSDEAPTSHAGALPARELRLRAVEAHLALGQKKAAAYLVSKTELSAEDREVHPQLAALLALAKGALALQDDDFEAALQICRPAVELARGAGHRRDALRICGVLARALIQADRPAEARALLERELEYLRQQAEFVPQAHRAEFYAVPTHQALVELLRELRGDIPTEFAPANDAPKASNASAEHAEGLAQPNAAGAGEQMLDLKDPTFRRWRSRYKKIVGEAPRLHQLFRVLDRVAASDSPVLLLGESGTGKELMAEAVHVHSERANGAFVKVNCAAFVEELLLSELFGHVKGAFTGAHADKIGRFELAHGGTIFLDEIGDISPKTQVALLRVLQEGRFEKVGSAETQSVDVRLVCATNKNLEEMVQRGEFRLDLYYRLKGVVLEIPPLRERRQDIVRLAYHFAHEFAAGEKPRKFSPEALQFLSAYNWPGNIRELQNFVRSVLLFVEGDTVEMSHLQDFGDFFAGGEVDLALPEIDYSVELPDYEQVGEVFEDPEEALVERIIAQGLSLAKIKSRLELESIRRALIESGGNITRAAELLQMKRPRLSQIVNASEELAALKNKLVS